MCGNAYYKYSKEVSVILEKWKANPTVQKILNSRGFYFAKRLYERYSGDDVSGMSAEATYYLILALVPFLIFIINILLFFAASKIDDVLAFMAYVPGDTRATLEPIIMDIIGARSSAVLGVGLLLALWSASKGVDTLIRATDQAFGTNKQAQTYVQIKLKSVVFTMLIAGTMVVALGVLVFGNAIVQAIDKYFSVDIGLLVVWNIAKYLVPFVAMIIVIAIFYRYAPGFIKYRGRIPWRYSLTASAVVTTLWLLMTAGYSFYVSNIANMGATYGSLVGLMILFIWLNLTSLILIMGAEFIMAFEETKAAFAIPDEDGRYDRPYRIV